MTVIIVTCNIIIICVNSISDKFFHIPFIFLNWQGCNLTVIYNMAHLKQVSIPDLPDEVIEHIMIFLSFSDLFKLTKAGTRLENCAKRVSKKKPFRK